MEKADVAFAIQTEAERGKVGFTDPVEVGDSCETLRSYLL